MNCKNCSAIVTDKFCSSCGQKAEVHRITIKHVLHDFLHAFTHADKGFLLLIKELLTRPGFVAKNFIDGQRKKYFNPLSFLVITSAIFAYFALTTGYMDALTGGQRAGETAQVAKNAGKALSLFLIVPLYALITWIFHIRTKYNYAENFVLNSFLFGEAAIFRTLVMIPVFLLFPKHTVKLNWFIYEPIFLIYTIVALKQFFNQNIFLTILKAIAIRISFVLLFWGILRAYVELRNLLM